MFTGVKSRAREPCPGLGFEYVGLLFDDTGKSVGEVVSELLMRTLLRLHEVY